MNHSEQIQAVRALGTAPAVDFESLPKLQPVVGFERGREGFLQQPLLPKHPLFQFSRILFSYIFEATTNQA